MGRLAAVFGRLCPGFFGAMLGNGAQAVYRRRAEPSLQALEQRARSLGLRFGLEQIGVAALERPEYAARHAQRDGRHRERNTLQAILDETQQPLSIESRLAQIEALDGRRPVQVQECELDGNDFCLTPVELCAELAQQMLDGFEENGAVDAFLAELGNRAPAMRRMVLG